MTPIDQLKSVLCDSEGKCCITGSDEDRAIIDRALQALTQSQQQAEPVQEPVARVIDNGTPEGATEWIPFTNRVEPLETGDLLYTAPPQRPWVGLTVTTILDMMPSAIPAEYDGPLMEFARAVEAKLKERNK